MKKPDTLIAKYYFLFLVGFLIFFFFSVMIWILSLSGRCGKNEPVAEKEEKKKKSNTFIYLMISVLVCSMAAQAVNQSYTRIVK
jgi:cytosine/uracil/thiamine/allantoin permease